MIHYAVIFFVVALIAAVFGFAGIAAGASGVAKILFFVFLILSVVSFIANTARGCPTAKPRKLSKTEQKAKRLAHLQYLFPMGREFNYLGLHMRVVGHLAWSWDNSKNWPCLITEYVHGGKIHLHELTVAECEVLAKELAK